MPSPGLSATQLVVAFVDWLVAAADGRLPRLPSVLPLPVIEVSHLLGSIVGTFLLLLARAVQRRVDAAYHLTIGALVVGIVVSLAKGLDWEEALVLATVLALFVPCRDFFDRHAAVRADAFSAGWTIAVVAAVLGAGLTFELAYRHVEYAHDLWWHFSLAGEASWSLRALAAIGVVLATVSVGHLLSPARRGGTHVPLGEFSLDGSGRKALRYSTRRFARDGYVFRVAPAAETATLLDRLEQISDAWLLTKHAREKRFSLGCFDRTYLAGQPVALVEREGEIVAFANLWCTGDHAEVSPDLMRHRDDAPAGTMEFLFTELLLWAKTDGYQWCSLGMAPLAGVEHRPLAPTWNRIGALVYRHGEHFYGFKGLRAFKDKFDPVWEPRYLAAPGGAGLARTLFDVVALVSGGVSGVVAR